MDSTRRVVTNHLYQDGSRVGPDRTVATFEAERWVGCPAVARGGDLIALAWSSPEGVNIANLDGNGAIVGAPAIVVPTTDGLGVSLASDGNGYGLVWEEGRGSLDERQIGFIRLDLAGSPTGAPQVLVPRAEFGEGPTIAAGSTGFAVAWFDGNTVLLQRLAADGSPLGEPTSDRGSGASLNSSEDFPPAWSPPVAIAPSGSTLGLAWRYVAPSDNGSLVRFHVTERDAPELGDARPISIATRLDEAAPFAAASPDGFLVAWTSYPFIHIDSIRFSSRLRFVRFDSAGQPLPPIEAIGSDLDARAAGFDGTQYVLLLTTSDGGLYALKVDP